jgi:hypothetical protein
MTTDRGRTPPQQTSPAELSGGAFTVRERARLALCYVAYKLSLSARALVDTGEDWWANPGHYVDEARRLVELADEVLERAVIVERESGTRWSTLAASADTPAERAATMRRWAAADRVWRAAVEAHVPMEPAPSAESADPAKACADDYATPGLDGRRKHAPADRLPVRTGATRPRPESACGYGGAPRLPGGASDPAAAAAILDTWFAQTSPPGAQRAAEATRQRASRADALARWSETGVLPIPGQPKPGRAPRSGAAGPAPTVRPITAGLLAARERDRGIADRRLKAAIEDVLVAAAPLRRLRVVPPELVHLIGPLRSLAEAKANGVGHARLRRTAFELVCAPIVPLGRFPGELSALAEALAVLRHAIERV